MAEFDVVWRKWLIAIALVVVGSALVWRLRSDQGWSAALFESEAEEYAIELELTGLFDEEMQVMTADCPDLESTRPGATFTCRIDYVPRDRSFTESVAADFVISGGESFTLTGLHRIR